MTSTTTPTVGFTIPVVGTNEPWSSAVYDANWGIADTEFAARRAADTALAGRATTLEGGAGRPGAAGGADWVVTNPAALAALTTGKAGDVAWMSAPGTGISPMFWAGVSGTGASTIWNPLDHYVASTKANADAFATAINAIADLVIPTGCRIFYGDTKLWGIHTGATLLREMHEGQRVGGLTTTASGGTASGGSDGTISVTACTATLDIDGVDAAGAIFTSFKIIVQVDSSVGTGAMTLSLRSGGSLIGATSHSYVRMSAQNAAVSSAEVGQTTGWSITAAALATGVHYIEVTVRGFTSATRKQGLVRAMATSNPMALATSAVEDKGIYYEAAGAADGFRLAWSGTSWTGSVQVVGVL